MIRGFKSVDERCCRDSSPWYQSYWSFPSFSCAFLLMTILFLPKIGRCGLTRIFEVWTVLGAWTRCCAAFLHPAPLLHLVGVGRQRPVPLFPHLPGLIEGKLERAPSPYTSFLPMKGSLSQPVVGGGSRTLIAEVPKCSSEPGCSFSSPCSSCISWGLVF